MDDIGETGDIGVALLDDGEGQNREIHSDDAATDRLALALTGTAGSVAGVAIGEQETDTGWMHNTLLHGEALLVVAAGDLEDVALEFITNGVAWNLGTHSIIPQSASFILKCRYRRRRSRWCFVPLLHEHSQLSLILDLNQLLAAIGRLLGVSLCTRTCARPRERNGLIDVRRRC